MIAEGQTVVITLPKGDQVEIKVSHIGRTSLSGLDDQGTYYVVGLDKVKTNPPGWPLFTTYWWAVAAAATALFWALKWG